MKNLKFLLASILLIGLSYSCEKNDVEAGQLLEEENANDSADKDLPVIDSLRLEFTQETKEDQMGKFSHNQVVHFNGEFWSVGGYNSYSGNQTSSQVWKSSNGVNWVSITENQFPNRRDHTLTVYDNKMWLIGGKTEVPGGFLELNDVWYSVDGYTWILATDVLPFYSLSSHSVVVFVNRLFVIKEGSGEGHSGNTVWSSADGVSWRMENSNAFPLREGFNTVIFENEIYVLGGVLHAGPATEFYSDVFKSSDGVSWTRLSPIGTPFSERAYGQTVVYDNKIWIIGGEDASTSIDKGLWYSEDGQSWTEYVDLPSRDGLTNFATTVVDSAIWIFGGMHLDESSGVYERAGEISNIKKL